MRYFLELGRQGKLSGAARALQVEHSTVSRRVGALEQQLGVRLFDRLPKSWSLTSEGEALLAHARRIEDEALAFARTSLSVGALQGPVRISAPPVFASAFLMPRLAELRHRWSGITIELIGEARVANLYRREADLAIRMARPEEPGLATRPLAHLGYGLYATPDWAGRPPDEWHFIGYDDTGVGWSPRPWLDKLAADRPVVLRTNDIASIYQACRAGFGVALLPHFVARGDPALVTIPAQFCGIQRELWMVIHPDVRRSPRVREVAAALADLLRQHSDVLA